MNMKIKKGLEGSTVFVRGFGFTKVNEANKQFLINQGYTELFQNDVKNPKITIKQVSDNVKRIEKRSKSK